MDFFVWARCVLVMAGLAGQRSEKREGEKGGMERRYHEKLCHAGLGSFFPCHYVGRSGGGARSMAGPLWALFQHPWENLPSPGGEGGWGSEGGGNGANC